MGQICKSPSFFLNQNRKQYPREERENKIYNISKTKLEADLMQNTRILESWKLLTKYKLQYFPKILGAEKL